MPSNSVTAVHYAVLDGGRPARLPPVWLASQALNGTGTVLYYGPVQPVKYGTVRSPNWGSIREFDIKTTQ